MTSPSPPPESKPAPQAGTALAAFLAGLRAAATSVFVLVLFGTYIGIGALAHDLGFSVGWVVLSTLLVWAAPAQVILITALGGGARLIEVALAVALSGVRFLPMVVALLPMLRAPDTSRWRLLLPAHFTAVSVWIETLRLAPRQPREYRIALANGIGTGLVTVAAGASIIGYYLAGQVPTMLAAALLFLTPLSFLMSTVRNSRQLVDRLSLLLGLGLAPALAVSGVGLDLLWTGIGGGTLAYVLHRLREATQ
jgi:predicted branched-subunit amino acid permease